MSTDVQTDRQTHWSVHVTWLDTSSVTD